MTGPLRGQTVLVIGRGGGIAHAVAVAARDTGARVVAAGRDQHSLAAVYAGEPEITTETVDLTDEASIAALGKRLGAVGHVVSTASAGTRGRLADLDRDAIRRSFDTKVIGPLLLAKHLAPRMTAGGSFVLFSGVAAAKITVGTLGVAITNGAADVLARSLALELAPIRVNAISPGARRCASTAVSRSPDSTPAVVRPRIPEGRSTMGLSWQQGPLAPGAIGRFLVPDPLPDRLLYAEPLRRRMRVRFGGAWIADSEDVVLLHEPGRYPVAYFPLADIVPGVLQASEHTTSHRDLGPTSWYTVRAGAQSKPRAAWQHTELPDYAGELKGRVAFAWRAMDAFYEEDQRIVGHAADIYHRIDIRKTSRHLVVRHGDQVIADTTRPLALYESGFAPRWYVPRADVNESALTAVEGQTFCPYKGLCSYYDIGDAHRAAWSYLDAWPEVGRVAGFISFEPDKIEVSMDGRRLRLEPGQSVVPHGIDRDLTLDEAPPGGRL